MKSRIALLSFVLMGCTAVQGSPTFEVHDVLFYGDSNDRVTWFYDTQETQQAKPLKINGLGYELKAQTLKDNFNLPGTLAINGQTSMLTKTTPITRDLAVTYNAATEHYFLKTSRDLLGVYLFEGGNWYKLSGSRSAGFSGELTSNMNTTNLQGVGELTDAEANALQVLLGKTSPLIVGVLKDAPDAPLSIDPKPVNYRTTALYVQQGVSQQSTPTPPTPGGPVSYSEVKSGSNSGYASPNFGAGLINRESTYQAVWDKTNARILPSPTAPDLDFNASSAVFLFMGQRPTGGFGFRVDRMEAEGSTLTVHVTVSSPKAGSITTQAFTSPWKLLSVSGKYSVLEVVDQNGKTLIRTSANSSPF